jgi:carboxyl-terminal processing protease
MRKSLSLVILLGLLCASGVFPQAKGKTTTQLPQTEPFKIGRGGSFAASSSRPLTETAKAPGASTTEAISSDFSEALAIIRENHVNGAATDYNELAKSSISSMLRTLDPHSNYFDSDEWRELMEDQRSEYFGVGATIVNYEKDHEVDTYIVSTFPDSPASRANLRFADKILAVNGEKMSGKSSDIVRDKIRGKNGTPVRLTIERADTRRQETIEIRRGRVPQPSIPDAYILRPGVGYIELSEGFNYTTFDELEAAMRGLREQGMKSLVLDLRGNPGGIVEQSVKVAESFLPAGAPIVSQRGRSRLDNRSWKSGNMAAETMPLAVLVDENSASASEIVAGALQDSDRALLVGEKTFGKGLVQSVISLPYGSGLTLTAARYYTPSGRSIQRDYSRMNIYDYFSHKSLPPEQGANAVAMRTVTGRKVFGGDGITPDEIVKTPELTRREAALLDPIFFFSREVVSGRVAGFESYKVSGRLQYGQRIDAGNSPVTNELLAAFNRYVEKNKSWNIPGWEAGTENVFIKTRLRYALVMADFGAISANQVLIEEDPQVAKAVEALPRAQQLALSARRTIHHQ